MVDLSVKIGKLRLKNPVMAASGTFGEVYGELVDISALGAYVAKTITFNARQGNPAPRVCETPSGMLNSIGLENRGVEYFIKERLAGIRKYKVPIIVSVAGESAEEFASIIKRLERERIDAYELNLSCPNVKHGRHIGLIAQDDSAIKTIVKKVRRVTKRTMIAKLSPNVTDITLMAKAAEDSGADALLVANTFVGMSINIDTKRPRLGNVVGGLSGPAIRPIALRMVYQARKVVSIPIIGCGGIMNYKDALEFIIAGASAVQVGTANFVNPKATEEIITGLERYLKKEKAGIKDIIGSIRTA